MMKYTMCTLVHPDRYEYALSQLKVCTPAMIRYNYQFLHNLFRLRANTISTNTLDPVFGYRLYLYITMAWTVNYVCRCKFLVC